MGLQCRPGGSDESEETRERRSREDSPQGKKLTARLEDLRKLNKAEKQVEEYRGQKRNAKQKKSLPKRNGRDRRSKKSRSRRSRSRRKKSRGAKSTIVARGGVSPAGRISTGADEEEDTKNPPGLKTLENPVQQKRKGSFRPRSMAERAARLPETEVPGEGPAVDFRGDGGSNSDDSGFQKAPSKSTKSSQLKLLSYSRKCPGRLASRLLLKMSQATARGLEGDVKAKDAASSYEPPLDGSPAHSPVQDREGRGADLL